MKATVGDRIVMAGEQVDRPTRDGQIVEVRGPHGAPPFLVRWSDGHTGLIYPGPGSVLSMETDSGGSEDPGAIPEQRAPTVGAAHEWTVRISVFEGDDTTARAVLVADRLDDVAATGTSHRSDTDRPQARIGDEVAVARALRHLADELLATATSEISAATGETDIEVSAT